MSIKHISVAGLDYVTDYDIELLVDHVKPDTPVLWRTTDLEDDWAATGLLAGDVSRDALGTIAQVRRHLKLDVVSAVEFHTQLRDALGEGFPMPEVIRLCDYLQSQGLVAFDEFRGYHLTKCVDLPQLYKDSVNSFVCKPNGPHSRRKRSQAR